MTKKTKEKVVKPSNFAIRKSVYPSDGYMFSGKWEDRNDITDKNWNPIQVLKRNNIGTFSSWNASAEDKIKSNPTIAGYESAILNKGDDTLMLSFSLNILSFSKDSIESCNSSSFLDVFVPKTEKIKKTSFYEISYLMCHNIASGRFLHRNRAGAEDLMVVVKIKNGKSFCFDSYDFSLKDFDKQRDNKELNELSRLVCDVLSAEDKSLLVEINAFSRIGDAQEVYPSQNMIDGVKLKNLFTINDQCCINQVKINNALRTFDMWHGDGDKILPVEAYGASVREGKAYRMKKNDIYSIMEKFIIKDEDLEDEESHFFAGFLMRGGLMAMTNSKNKEK